VTRRERHPVHERDEPDPADRRQELPPQSRLEGGERDVTAPDRRQRPPLAGGG